MRRCMHSKSIMRGLACRVLWDSRTGRAWFGKYCLLFAICRRVNAFESAMDSNIIPHLLFASGYQRSDDSAPFARKRFSDLCPNLCHIIWVRRKVTSYDDASRSRHLCRPSR